MAERGRRLMAKRWADLKARMSPERQKRMREHTDALLLEMDLRELRKLVGVTQAQLAERLKTSQGEVSQAERRDDKRLSTRRSAWETSPWEVFSRSASCACVTPTSFRNSRRSISSNSASVCSRMRFCRSGDILAFRSAQRLAIILLPRSAISRPLGSYRPAPTCPASSP